MPDQGSERVRLGDVRVELADLERRLSGAMNTLGRLSKAVDALEDAPTRNRDVVQPGVERRHSGKYKPLFEHLRRAHGQGPLRLTFEEVESILDFKLPPSSRRHLPHWYGYGGSAVARAIQDAGWRARRVDLDRETVEFHEVEH